MQPNLNRPVGSAKPMLTLENRKTSLTVDNITIYGSRFVKGNVIARTHLDNCSIDINVNSRSISLHPKSGSQDPSPVCIIKFFNSRKLDVSLYTDELPDKKKLFLVRVYALEETSHGDRNFNQQAAAIYNLVHPVKKCVLPMVSLILVTDVYNDAIEVIKILMEISRCATQ